MIPPLDIFKVEKDGTLQFIETVDTLEAAQERARGFARLWPAEYVIVSRITGNKTSIKPNVN